MLESVGYSNVESTAISKSIGRLEHPTSPDWIPTTTNPSQYSLITFPSNIPSDITPTDSPSLGQYQ